MSLGVGIMKRIERKSSISIVLTLLIITLLILSGPAAAVSINVSSLPTKVKQGNSLSFTLDTNINSGEKIPIYNISINVMNSTGNSVGNYTFSPDGKNLTSGITVSLITSAPFGYGYRYGYGYAVPLGYKNYTFGYGYGYGYGTSSSKFEYNITITDFSKLSPGNYSLRILVDTGTGNYYTTVTVPVVGVVPAPTPVIVPVVAPGVTTHEIKIGSIGNITVKAGANVTVGIPLHSASEEPDVNIYLENLPSGWSAEQLKVTLPLGNSKAEIELMVPENVTGGTYKVLIAVASAWFGKTEQKFNVIVTTPAKKPSKVTPLPPPAKKPSNVTISPPTKKKPSNVTAPPPAKKKGICGPTLIALLAAVPLALRLRRRRRV